MTRPRQLALLDALKQHEGAGTGFTLPELAAQTGYKLSSLKTYHAKRFRDRLVFEQDDGSLVARGTLEMNDDEFLSFMDQTGAAELARDTRFRELLDRADAAMGLAVELYHRPGVPGGLVLYARLATEAWILLLGAELVRGQSASVLAPLEAGHFPALDAALAEAGVAPALHDLLRGVAEIGNLSLCAEIGSAAGALSGVAERHCQAWLERREDAVDLGVLVQLRRAGEGAPSAAVAELSQRLSSLVPSTPVERTQPLPSLLRQATFDFQAEEAERRSGADRRDLPPSVVATTGSAAPLVDRVLRVVREAGGPVDIEELADETGARRGEVEAVLEAMEEVYRAGRTTWIHRLNLGLAASELADVTQWALEEIEGEDEPVTVAAILRDAADSGVRVDALTPWLLRDALSRHPDVVTFANPKMVAHIETFRDGGVALLDRLEGIVRGSGAEATFAQIIAALPAGVQYHPVALAGLLQGARWCVRLGSGRYCHVSATGLDTDARKQLMDAAIAALGSEQTTTSVELLGGLDAAVPRPGVAEPSRVLWGLLLADPRVQCGPGLRVAGAKHDAGIGLLIEGIVEVLVEHGELGAQDLRRAATARYGYRGLDSFRGALSTAVDRGLIAQKGSRYAPVH